MWHAVETYWSHQFFAYFIGRINVQGRESNQGDFV